MSRQIDLNQSLTDEDRKYLADRGRTVEQEQAYQDTVNLAADRITGDADALPARIEYARRTGQGFTGDDMAPGFVRRPGVSA